MKFYTADHHFGHARIIELCGRPFSCVEEMDEAMIARHNERVEKSDDVYFIGDFGFASDQKYMQHVFGRLKGRKHLVIGNHDKKAVLRLPWASPPKDRMKVEDKGRTFILSHYAERVWDRMYRGAFHLFGHTHGKLPGVGRSTDAGVDAWDFRPVTADEAIERMMAWNHDFDTYAPEEPSVIRGPLHPALPSPSI